MCNACGYTTTVHSTELLVHGAASWSYSVSLTTTEWPTFVKAVSLNNKILFTGNFTEKSVLNNEGLNFVFDSGTLEDILEFDEISGVWKKVGSLRSARRDHAASVINYNAINSLLPVGRYINMDPYPTGLLISWT